MCNGLVHPIHRLCPRSFLIIMATRTDLLTVREFFSSDEWDIIDAALSEYQDHYDTDEEAATYNTLVGRIANLFTINTDA